MIFGQFMPEHSIVHRMDPRAKLIFVFVFMLGVFWANNFITYGLLILVTVLALFCSHVPLSFLYQAVKPIFIIILFTSLLHLWVTKGGEIWVDLPFITIYEEGVKQALFISIRFLVLMGMASLLTFTTSPIDLTDGLERLLQPLTRLGVPAHEWALMMSIALRFIPTLLEETEKIKKAQMARGVDFESGHVIQRVKSYIPVLIPLFISAFRRADELAMAMESRCYRGGKGRTKFRELQFSYLDLFLLLLLVALLSGLWVFRK